MFLKSGMINLCQFSNYWNNCGSFVPESFIWLIHTLSSIPVLRIPFQSMYSFLRKCIEGTFSAHTHTCSTLADPLLFGRTVSPLCVIRQITSWKKLPPLNKSYQNNIIWTILNQKQKKLIISIFLSYSLRLLLY